MAIIFRSSTDIPMQTLLLMAVITVFGAALRLCFLENTTLWFDERVSWELAAGSWKHFGTKYLNGKQICFSASFAPPMALSGRK
jgi:hypothetical protein